MTHSMQMGEEKKPSRKKLLPEGWRQFEILNCIDGISKAGNAKVIVTVRDVEMDYEEDLHLVAEPKKRWALKNLLDACGVSAAEDGVYNWSHKDIIGQKVSGLIEHEPNEWINREGETVKGIQHRFVEFKQVAWDDN